MLPDVVYMLRRGQEYEELRYSLRSIAANLPHGRVWVYGARPDWLGRDVIHVHVDQPGRKHYNTARITEAIAQNRDLTPVWYWFHDDMYVTAPVDEVPVLHRGDWSNFAGRYPAFAMKAQATEETLAAFGKPAPTISYDIIHTPMPVVRNDFSAMVEAVLTWDPEALVKVAKRSLYGNWFQVGGAEHPDVKFRGRDDPLCRPFASSADRPTRHTSAAGRELVGLFPRRCRYER